MTSKSNKKSVCVKFSRWLVMALVVILCFPSVSAHAAKVPVDTLLDHPDFGDTSYCPSNRFYDTTNIHGAIWSYGYEVNTLNMNGTDAVINEVLTQVLAKKKMTKYKNRWFSMWMEGADLSKQNLEDLYNAGFNILGLTYYDYWIETVLTTIDTDYYEPRYAIVDDEDVKNVLTAAGHDLEKYPVGMLTVSGVSMPLRSCVFYCPDFTFLNKKTVHGYKYYPEAKLFVKLDEVRYNGYKKKFLDIYYGKKGKEGNGLYVFTTVDIPSSLVTDESAIEDFIATNPVKQEESKPEDSIKEDKTEETSPEESTGSKTATETQPAEDLKPEEEQPNNDVNTGEISEDKDPDEPEKDDAIGTDKEMTDTEEVVYVPDETPAPERIKVDGFNKKDAIVVEWIFGSGSVPKDFDSRVEIGWTGSNEVTVDFAYSGALPDDTMVTLYIPFNKSGFKDGDVLYLYYCNPETGLREKAGEGKYDEGLATFSLSHCSVYIVTDENHGENYSVQEEKAAIPFTAIVGIIAGVVVLAGIGSVVLLRKKK